MERMEYLTPNFQAPHYVIPTALPEKMLGCLKEQCEGFDDFLSSATTFSGFTPKLRESKLHWIHTDNWISALMAQLIVEANREFFRYDITKWTDQIQYTVYEGRGSKYGWHYDPTDDPSQQITRKLSISLILSDPSEYEGGEFQMHALDKLVTLKPPAGTAIIFPSLTPHRVRPLKSGIRKSLVGWMGGPPWK
jgi:PKHD-type hydroxylase